MFLHSSDDMRGVDTNQSNSPDCKESNIPKVSFHSRRKTKDETKNIHKPPE